MNASIEIIQWDEAERLHDVVGRVYDNQEPGFQVDGVTNMEQFNGLLQTIKNATPANASCYAEPNNAFDIEEYFRLSRGVRMTDLGLHADGGNTGLAIHHNISDKLPVFLATAPPEAFPDKYSSLPLDTVKLLNIREGNTLPGRLTVFSEGNLPDQSLLPAAHHFIRSRAYGPNLWTRYEHTELGAAHPMHVQWAANRALHRVVEYKVAS